MLGTNFLQHRKKRKLSKHFYVANTMLISKPNKDSTKVKKIIDQHLLGILSQNNYIKY